MLRCFGIVLEISLDCPVLFHNVSCVSSFGVDYIWNWLQVLSRNTCLACRNISWSWHFLFERTVYLFLLSSWESSIFDFNFRVFKGGTNEIPGAASSCLCLAPLKIIYSHFSIPVLRVAVYGKQTALGNAKFHFVNLLFILFIIIFPQ